MALNIGGWKSSNKKVNSFMVNDVERLLGIKLPQSYIELMKEWNGGFLQEEHQILVDGIIPEKLNYYLGEKLWALSAVAGISIDIKKSEGIVCVTQTAREWGIPEGVIAFDGDGHTWIAFDYRRSPNEPKIIFIESDELICYDLAENFSAFINRLIPSSKIFDHDGNIFFPITLSTLKPVIKFNDMRQTHFECSNNFPKWVFRMDLSVFLGQPVSEALESVKKLTGIVQYSKIEGDEFVKAPEMGFYLQSKDGVGVVSAYRIYMVFYDPYMSAPDEVKGEFQGCDDVSDVEKIVGQPIRNIPSIEIPGGNSTLRGKMYSWRDYRVMAHFDDGDNLVYLHFKML